MKSKRGHFDWDTIYNTIPFSKMGWHYDLLDPDLETSLKAIDKNGKTFLDIGSGSGTQSIQLSKMGFTVTGTDISKTAIDKTNALNKEIEFIHDNILNTKLTKEYDYIFDRGCFHNLREEIRIPYILSVQKLLKQNGKYFLKCFSANPEIKEGPYQYSTDEIEIIFKDYFVIESIKQSVYQGQMKTDPKALFIVMKKR